MSELVDSLPEVFARLGPIRTRRMFGGHGIYVDDRMFALVAQGTLFLKCGEQDATEFDRLGLPPFTYLRQGKPTPTSYRQAPEEIFEDWDMAAQWGRRAWEAAARSASRAKSPKPKPKPKPKTKPTPTVRGTR